MKGIDELFVGTGAYSWQPYPGLLPDEVAVGTAVSLRMVPDGLCKYIRILSESYVAQGEEPIGSRPLHVVAVKHSELVEYMNALQSIVGRTRISEFVSPNIVEACNAPAELCLLGEDKDWSGYDATPPTTGDGSIGDY